MIEYRWTGVCPLCSGKCIVEEGSSGSSYAFCQIHKYVAHENDAHNLVLEPWVIQALEDRDN